MCPASIDAPEISVVIPVYNEARLLPVFFGTLTEILNRVSESYEIIIVDDGSKDESWSLIRETVHAMPFFRAIRLSRNFGKESALSSGLEIAKGRAVVIMDADLQHPPDLLPEMFDRWRSGDCDVVEAVRNDRGATPRWNNVAANFFYNAISRLSGFSLNGATDFKLLDRRVVEAWKQLGERTLFFRGMSAWLGFRRSQVTFSTPSRLHGASRFSPASLFRLGINGLTSFTSAPLHLVTVMGLLFLAFALILGLQTFYMKYFGGAVDGFTTVIIVLLFVGSIIMVALGIVGEYLARIYEEVKNRPRYIISDRLNL